MRTLCIGVMVPSGASSTSIPTCVIKPYIRVRFWKKLQSPPETWNSARTETAATLCPSFDAFLQIYEQCVQCARLDGHMYLCVQIHTYMSVYIYNIHKSVHEHMYTLILFVSQIPVVLPPTFLPHTRQVFTSWLNKEGWVPPVQRVLRKGLGHVS